MKSAKCQTLERKPGSITEWQNEIKCSDLAAPARLVLFVLSSEMQSINAAVTPTMQGLSASTGQGERTVRRALQAAQDAGFVSVDRCPVADGHKSTVNHYSARLPPADSEGPARMDSGDPNGRNVVQFPAQPATLTGSNGTSSDVVKKRSTGHSDRSTGISGRVGGKGENGLDSGGATTPARTCGKELYIYKYNYNNILLPLKQSNITILGYASTFGVGPGILNKSNYNRVPPREAVAAPTPSSMLALPPPVQQSTAVESAGQIPAAPPAHPAASSDAETPEQPIAPAEAKTQATEKREAVSKQRPQQNTSRPSLPAPEHGVPEIAAMLGQHAASLIPQWYPEAKPLPAENPRRYVMGSIRGERGRSFAIYVRDSGRHRAGRCYESNGGKPGDMLDLLEHVENLTRNQAIKRAREIVGIPQLGKGSASATRRVVAPPPPPAPEPAGPRYCEMPDGIRAIRADSAAGKYMTQDRSINAETLATYRIAEFRNQYSQPCVGFPAFHGPGQRDGKPGAMKSRNIKKAQAAAYAEASGGEVDWKGFFAAKNGDTGISFGRQAVPADAEQVVYSEGEIDAMTWRQQTEIPAMSVPHGAGAVTWLASERGFLGGLSNLSVIYIAMDSDAAGQSRLREICESFGMDRCWVLEPPNGKKDANKALQCGATESDFCEAIASATPASKLFAEQAGSAQ